LGPDLPGKWAFSPFGLMPDVVLLCFFVYFKHVFCIIPTCPPVNDESPKLVELVSYKPEF
jgi:hypothetical protein